jgi:hypothetical protein
LRIDHGAHSGSNHEVHEDSWRAPANVGQNRHQAVENSMG